MSTLKVNKIRDTAGSADSITLDPNGGAVVAGVTTASTIKVGSGVTISSDGDIFHTGVCTATSFAGEIPAASIVGVCTSGLTKTGGFGKILQIKNVTKTDTFSANISSGTFSGSAMELAFTAASTSNRLLFIVNCSLGMGAADSRIGFALFADGSVINASTGDAPASGNNKRVTTGGSTNADTNMDSQGMNYYHTPTSTSSITYSVRVFNGNTGTQNVSMNYAYGMGEAASGYRGMSSMTIMEISA